MIQVNPFAADTVNSASSVQSSAQSAKGEAQLSTPAQSILQQAQSAFEELGFSLASLRRRKSKEVKGGSELNESRNHVLRKLAEAAFDNGKLAEIEGCLHHLRQEKEIGGYLTDWLKGFSKDKTQQYIALLWMRQELGQQGDAVSKQSVQHKIDELLADYENSHEVIIGTNAYRMIAESQLSSLDKTEARETFESSDSIKLTNLSDLWTSLSELYGEEGLVDGIKPSMMKLSAEYHAGGRGIEKAYLVGLMKGMSLMKTLMAVYDQCLEIASVLEKAQSESTLKRDRLINTLCQKVISLQMAQWVDKKVVNQIAQELGMNEDASKAVLGVQLKRIYSLLPEHIYSDPNQRQQCITLLSNYADVSARREADNA